MDREVHTYHTYTRITFEIAGAPSHLLTNSDLFLTLALTPLARGPLSHADTVLALARTFRSWGHLRRPRHVVPPRSKSEPTFPSPLTPLALRPLAHADTPLALACPQRLGWTPRSWRRLRFRRHRHVPLPRPKSEPTFPSRLTLHLYRLPFHFLARPFLLYRLLYEREADRGSWHRLRRLRYRYFCGRVQVRRRFTERPQ